MRPFYAVFAVKIISGDSGLQAFIDAELGDVKKILDAELFGSTGTVPFWPIVARSVARFGYSIFGQPIPYDRVDTFLNSQHAVITVKFNNDSARIVGMSKPDILQ